MLGRGAAAPSLLQASRAFAAAASAAAAEGTCVLSWGQGTQVRLRRGCRTLQEAKPAAAACWWRRRTGRHARARRPPTLPWTQGALGLRDTRDMYEPELIPGLPPDVAAIGAGHFHSFAATADGQLWSWGRNNEAQLGRPLGDGEFGCSPAPAPCLGLEKHHVGGRRLPLLPTCACWGGPANCRPAPPPSPLLSCP